MLLNEFQLSNCFVFSNGAEYKEDGMCGDGPSSLFFVFCLLEQQSLMVKQSGPVRFTSESDTLIGAPLHPHPRFIFLMQAFIRRV